MSLKRLWLDHADTIRDLPRALISRSCWQISQTIGRVRRSCANGVPVHGRIIFVILLLFIMYSPCRC